MRIVAVHLLNDYSGSPKVLMQLLKLWTENKIESHLFISGKREGFLTGIKKVKDHPYWYQFQKNPILRLFFLLTSQFLLALQLLFFLKKKDIVYINTVLPFGAAIMAKLKGCKVIYHVHETSVKPKILKKILFGMAKFSASETVYVSQYIARKEPVSERFHVLYNVLEQDFVQIAEQAEYIEKQNIVLMVCSLKIYKGVNEFLELAIRNPNFTFKLVLNAKSSEIESYFEKLYIPENLLLVPVQKNLVPFYQEAKIILNLSDTDLWVETFGLTVLEGMAFGLPAIVPPVGGVTELVNDGENGFLVDSKEIDILSKKLRLLLSDETLYLKFSKNALHKAKAFSYEEFSKKSLKIAANFNQYSN